MSSSPRVRGYAFEPDIPPRVLNTLEELREEGPGKKFVWLDVEGPLDPAAETGLKERLDWHPIVLQNIRQSSTRARLTPFENYTHLSFGAVVHEDDGEGPARSVEVDAVIGEGYLVTFHQEPLPLMDQLHAGMPAQRKSPRSPDLLLYQVVAAGIESAAPELESLDDALAELEHEALNVSSPDLLDRIVETRDALYLLHLSLAPQIQMLHDVTSGACRFVTPYARPFFRSLENRLRGLIEEIAIHREVVQNTLELYRSTITQTTNETIRILTVISTPLLVLTFVTGLYGMNVSLPFSHSPRAFFVLLGISLAFFLGMLVWFRWRKWF